MDSDGDPSSSGSGSGVWEKSENSKWIVVAETKHRIPRKARVRTVASVDPSLGIREFITSFEPEEPPSAVNNSILVGDGSSLVRLDSSAAENMEEPQPGPSSEGSGASHEEAEREETPGDRGGRSRRRRQRRQRGQRVSGARRNKRTACVSVESSPGRDSPSPESLSRIVKKYSSGLASFS